MRQIMESRIDGISLVTSPNMSFMVENFKSLALLMLFKLLLRSGSISFGNLDGVKNMSLMSTNVIAFLLLNKFREGITIDVLRKELDLLQAELRARSHDLSIASDTMEVIKHGVREISSFKIPSKI